MKAAKKSLKVKKPKDSKVPSGPVLKADLPPTTPQPKVKPIPV